MRAMTAICAHRASSLFPSTAAALLLAALCIHGSAFAAAADVSPPAPAGFVFDEARTLSDSAKSALSDELLRFREATGCSLYVVSTTFLSGQTVRDRAEYLAKAWIPVGRGVVLAYDRASDAHAVAPTNGMWETYPTPALVEAFRDAGSMLQEKSTPLEQRLLEGSRLLVRRINETEQQRRLHNRLLPGHDLWIALVFFALLVASALVCRFIIARLHKRDAARAIRCFFPQAAVAMRFGAPYGGGVIAQARINQRGVTADSGS